MLHGQDPLRQRLGGIVVTHRNRALHHDRPRIGLRDHEMHRRTGNLDTGLSAWPCGSRPGNDGSSDGWMLSILPYQRWTNSAVNSRMKPARQISSTRCSSSAASSAVSNAARSLPNGLLSMTSVAMPAFLRCQARRASARLEITTAISAGKSPAFAAASISAAMFDPRPEIRMATRRFIASPRQIEVAVIDHAMLAGGRDDLAEQRNALAARGQDVGHLHRRHLARRSRSCRCRN